MPSTAHTNLDHIMVSTAWVLARPRSLTIKKILAAAPIKRKKKFELRRSVVLYILAISMIYSGQRKCIAGREAFSRRFKLYLVAFGFYEQTVHLLLIILPDGLKLEAGIRKLIA
jgi:hypothetical protein